MRRIAKNERFRYLDVSKKDKMWDLCVDAGGRILHRMPGAPDRGHPAPYYYLWDQGRKLDGFGISYITQGRGEYETEDTGHQIVEAGSIFITFPGVWHRYRPLSGSGWTNHWVHFGGSFGTRLLKRGLISPKNPILKVGLHSQILRPYLTLLDRLESDPPALQQLAAANVIEILGSALAAKPVSENDRELESMVQLAKATLAQRVNEQVDLKILASSLGMSYDYFRHIFKDHTGVPPYQFHLNMRLDRAKEMLQSTDMTIQEIAFSLQFETQYHFSRIFKKKIGWTPSKWRTQCRESDL